MDPLEESILSSTEHLAQQPASIVTDQDTAAVVTQSRALVLAVSAGAFAGLVAWGIGELTLNAFTPRPEHAGFWTNQFLVPTPASKRVAEAQNATLAFGVLGGLLGFGLGLAGGITARIPRRALTVGLIGLGLGAVLGVVPSLVGLPYYNELYFQNVPVKDLSVSIPLHLGVWVPLGAGAGLAFGLGRGGGRAWPGATVGGVLGAVLGVVLFDLLGAVLFPMAETEKPLSVTSTSRLLARLMVALLAALGAAALSAGFQSRAKVVTQAGS